MVPNMKNETHRLMYHRDQRTVTDNHIYQVYTSPNHKSFVQCEGEYHTVKEECTGPCDSSGWFLELIVTE